MPSSDPKKPIDLVDQTRPATSRNIEAKARKPSRTTVSAEPRLAFLESGTVQPLSEWIKELARTTRGSTSPGRRLAYLLLPTSPGEQDINPLTTHDDLATALNDNARPG